METDKKELVQGHVETLVKDIVRKSIDVPSKSISDLFLELRNIQYMSFMDLKDGDISAIVVSYNLYYFDNGVQKPLYGEDKEQLARGVLSAALTLPYEDTLILKGESSSSKDINGLVVEELNTYVANLRGLKIPNSQVKLHGYGQHPDIPLNDIQPKWFQAIDKHVFEPLYVLVHNNVYEDLLNVYTEDDTGKHFLYVKVQQVKVYLEESWKVELLLNISDGRTKKVLLRKPIVVDTKFIYNNARYTEALEKLFILRLENKTETMKPYTFDTNTFSFQPFANLPTEVEKIVAEDKQTTYVKERIEKVLAETKDEDVVVVSFKNGIITLAIKSTVNEKKYAVYFGGNGILYNGNLYYRNGQETERDKKLAVKKMSELYGPKKLWHELLNCYDFRRKID